MCLTALLFIKILFSVVLSTAGACAMSLGYINPFLMMGYCYLALILFYLSHWQTYVTGKFFNTVGLFPKIGILYSPLKFNLQPDNLAFT